MQATRHPGSPRRLGTVRPTLLDLLAPLALALWLTAGTPSALAAPQVDDFAPRSGPPGTTITVQGSGFGTALGAVQASVGGVAATVTAVADTEVTLAAPVAEGPVSITVNGDATASLLPFVSTRTVTGAFTPPAGFDAAGYSTGTLTQGTVGASFSVALSAHAVELVFAWRETGDPLFAALVYPENNHVVIDAASTALALVAISPFAPRGDPAALDATLDLVAGGPELASLAALITEASAAGHAYVDDGRFAARFEALLLAAFPDGSGAASIPPALAAASAFVPPGAGYLRALEPDSPIADRRVDFAITQHTATPPTQRLNASPSATDPTRLNQHIELWRVNPSWFSDGFDHINRLSISDRPTQLDVLPYATGFVGAELGSENLDPGKWIGKVANWAIEGVSDTASTDALFILPRDRPAIYMVNSFSGNVWFGSATIDPARSQSALLSQIDPNGQWTSAYVANLLIASIDLASVVLPDIKILDRKDLGEVVKTVGVDVAKTVITYQAAYGSIDKDGAIQIGKTAAIGLAKAAVGKLAEKAENITVTGFFGALAKTAGEIFNVAGKLSSGLQAIERGTALVAPTHYAVERTILVIGDPFAPQIRSFQPTYGRAGDSLLVYGENLPFTPTNLQFSFVTFEATGSPPPLSARLDVPIAETNGGVYRVKLPTAAQWEAAFGPGDHDVFLSIRNTVTGGETTTQANPFPNYQFTYRAPPQITAVIPSPARSGDIVEITGPRFDPLTLRDLALEVDGQSAGYAFSATSTRIFARLPGGLADGSHTLRVVFRDPNNFSVIGASNTVNFSVLDPHPAPTPSNSRSLTITRRDWSNTPDEDLSVREALALASGTLGRAITVRPENYEGSAHFESDWVSGTNYGGGASIRDSIGIAGFATGPTTIAVTSPVPLPGTGDTVSLAGLVLEASAGLPSDSVALDLRGVSGHQLNGVTFRNFPAEGVLLGNGSRFNRIDSVTVETCGGDGLVLAGDASDNSFYVPVIRAAGGVGVRLAGSGVTRNTLYSAAAFPIFGGPRALFAVYDSTDHGVLVEAGAHGNFLDLGEIRDSGGDGLRVTGAGTEGNQFGAGALPGFRDIAGSVGCGVRVEAGARGNFFTNLAVSGSGADGFRIQGADTTHNTVRSSATGFDFAAAGTDDFVSPDAGHGLVIDGAPWNTIGTRGADSGLNTTDNHFGGSLGGATVLITGADAHHNVLDASVFGIMDPLHVTDETPQQLLAPAATHALHLSAGAHDNTIGSAAQVAAAHFYATPHGAAIRIEGEGTDRNHVLGATIGRLRTDIELAGQQVRVGVHILDGAAANRIGETGVQLGQNWKPYNNFGNIEEAGIRLENLQATLSPDGEPTDANQLVQNHFGYSVFGGDPSFILHPEVCIHLLGQVTGQILGGPTRAHGNQFSRFGHAGIWLEGGQIPSYEHRNRITGTWSSAAVGTRHSTVNTDPFAGPVTAMPLLISGGARGQVVGEDWALYNQLSGGRVIAYLDGGDHHWLRACWFDLGARGTIFMRDATDCRVGGPDPALRMHLTRSATAGDDLTAAIVLAGGGRHRIESVLVGDHETVDTIWASRAHGILVSDSAGNRVGGPARASANTLVRCAGDAIRITGAGSTGNEIGNNRIGFGAPRSANQGNLGSGVHLLDGAHGNLVGGFQTSWDSPASPPLLSPNTIRDNTGDGVRVAGAATVGNSILANSIHSNGGLGIRHVDTGNRNQPPPSLLTLSEGAIHGQVASLAETPVGSVIEVFMNPNAPEPEGEVLFARGLVGADGRFSFPYPFLPPPGVITATATDALTGDTSQFTNAVVLPETFGLSLATPPGEGARTRAWPGGAAPFVAVPLTATSEGAEVEVTMLRVRALGSADAATAFAGVSLFEDVDRDGVWSAADRELSPGVAPAPFAEAVAELALTDARVHPDESRIWILRLHPAAGVAPAGTVQLEITDAAAVDERYWEPLGGTGVAAIFPLRSATLDAAGGPADGRPAWRASFGLPEDGTGDGADTADPDGDGLPNLAEYALGSSPIDAADAARPTVARASGPERLTLTYQRLRDDVVYSVEATGDLGAGASWSPSGVDQGDTGATTVTAGTPLTGARVFLRLRLSPQP